MSTSALEGLPRAWPATFGGGLLYLYDAAERSGARHKNCGKVPCTSLAYVYSQLHGFGQPLVCRDNQQYRAFRRGRLRKQFDWPKRARTSMSSSENSALFLVIFHECPCRAISPPKKRLCQPWDTYRRIFAEGLPPNPYFSAQPCMERGAGVQPGVPSQNHHLLNVVPEMNVTIVVLDRLGRSPMLDVLGDRRRILIHGKFTVLASIDVSARCSRMSSTSYGEARRALRAVALEDRMALPLRVA